MQNKTKILLVVVAVFGFGVFLSERVYAADCSCGTAINTSYSTAPTSNLCAAGNPSSINEADGYWNWTCGDGSCDEASCRARKTTEQGLGCCCEDIAAKQCTNVACPANCGASSTPHSTVCSSIPDSATACSGTASNPVSTSTPGSGIEIPTDTGLPSNPGLVKGILTNVANWLLGIIGILALIGFVIAGVQYFLVATDEKMMETAKKTAQASAIGIAVALSGYIVISAIEKILKGTSLF